jgi:hypothetical protein
MRSLKVDFSDPGSFKRVASSGPAKSSRQAAREPTAGVARVAVAARATVTATASTSTSARSAIGGSGVSVLGNTTSKAPRQLTILKPGALTTAIAGKWACDGCDALNAAVTARCTGCGAARASDIVAVAPHLSMAQKRGLVPAPAPLLTAAEWAAVEAKAQARLVAGTAATSGQIKSSVGGNMTAPGGGASGFGLSADGAQSAAPAAPTDDAEPDEPPVLPAGANASTVMAADPASCPICFEALGLREQVLLSCSHLFHRSCLDSFERYQRADKAAALACPMCRCTGYQKKRTRQGARLHVLRCVMRIQALYRGHVTRRAFWQLRRQFWLAQPVAGTATTDGVVESESNAGAAGAAAIDGRAALAADPRRRRAFAADMLAQLQRRLAVAQAARKGGIDALLAESDASVSASRGVFAAAEARLAARLAARQVGSTAVTSAAPGVGPLRSGVVPAAPVEVTAGAAPRTLPPDDVAGRLLEAYADRLVTAEAAPSGDRMATAGGAGVLPPAGGTSSVRVASAASVRAPLPASSDSAAAALRALTRAPLKRPAPSQEEWQRIMASACTRLRASVATATVGAGTGAGGAASGAATAGADADAEDGEVCPICIMPMLHAGSASVGCGTCAAPSSGRASSAGRHTGALDGKTSSADASRSGGRGKSAGLRTAGALTVLSCSHAFHDKCIRSLERFVATGTSYEPALSAGGHGSSNTSAVADTGSGLRQKPGGVAGTAFVISVMEPPDAAKCPTCRAQYCRVLLPAVLPIA